MERPKIVLSDINSGIVLLFVSLPVSIGIAHASGAPVYSSLVSTIIGGTVVLLLSKQFKIVSGPAAGLITIVYSAIGNFDSFGSFLLAVILAGIIQIVLGLLKAGIVFKQIPESISKGILVALGLLIFISQIPHLIGRINNASPFNNGAILIVISLIIIYYLINQLISSLKLSIVFLVCIILGLILTAVFTSSFLFLNIPESIRLTLPKESFTIQPIWNFKILNIDFPALCINGMVIAIIASIESLICIKAIKSLENIDKSDYKPDRELIAQGVGNILCGTLGGLPLAATMTRSAVNHYSGSKTKFAIIIHVALLVISVIFFKPYLCFIPLCIPAFILICIGYKLANPKVFRSLYSKKNYREFLLFFITVLSIVFSDLIKGFTLSVSLFMLGIFYDYLRLRDIKISSFTKIAKSVLSQQKKSLIVIGSGLVTFIISASKFFKYERNLINNLNIYAVILAIMIFYFWEKSDKHD